MASGLASARHTHVLVPGTENNDEQTIPARFTSGHYLHMFAELERKKRDVLERIVREKRANARRLASSYYETFDKNSVFFVPHYQVDHEETTWQDNFFFLGLGEADVWEEQELKRVRERFSLALQSSRAKYDYTVYDVTLVGNGELLNAYCKNSARETPPTAETSLQDCEQFVFHGTRESNISKIVAQGFRRKGARDPGLYGQGYYFTSNPEYAVHYLSEVKLKKEDDGMRRVSAGEEAMVIAAYVNLGKSFQVTDMSFFGKPLKEGFDSHHVFVQAKKFTPVVDRHDAIADEIVFDSTDRILPRYIISFRRKHTRLVWLFSDKEDSQSGIVEKVRKMATSGGHKLQVCKSLEDAGAEVGRALSLEVEESEEMIRFAVSGEVTSSLLEFLRHHAANVPIIVISKMLNFDRHVMHVRERSNHANMVTYSLLDVEMFMDLPRRDLVNLEKGLLVSIQEKSSSQPIAAAASRLQRYTRQRI